MKEKISSIFSKLRENVLSFDGELSDSIKNWSKTDKLVFTVLSILVLLSSIISISLLADKSSIGIAKRGGTLREGFVGIPGSLIPLIPQNEAGASVSRLIFAGLLKSDGRGNFIPELAESYSVSDDGLTYTFKLNPKAKFQDGVKVTSSDVIFSIDLFKSGTSLSPISTNWKDATIKAINEEVVEVKIKNSYNGFIENATIPILPEHLLKNIPYDSILGSDYATLPIGAGPFILKEKISEKSNGTEIYKFKSFNKYVLGSPYIEDIEIHFSNSEDPIIKLIESGYLDSAAGIVSKIENSEYVIKNVSLNRLFSLFINKTKNKFLESLDNRKEIASNINLKELGEEISLGKIELSSFPIPKGLREKVFMLKNDLNKDKNTKQTDKEVTEENDDTKKEKIVVTTPDIEDLKKIARAVQSSLKNKFDVDLKIVSIEEIENSVIPEKDFEILLFGQGFNYSADLYPFWHSSQRNYPGLNITATVDKDLDEAIIKSRETNSKKELISNYKKTEDLIMAEGTIIPLLSPKLSYISKNSVRGIEKLLLVNGLSDRFNNIENWYVESEKVWEIIARLFLKDRVRDSVLD